jgi:hypothetical protein
MPRDRLIREKFTKGHTAARKLAKEYFERYLVRPDAPKGKAAGP